MPLYFRCKIWLKNCQLDPDILSKKNIKLCSKRFEVKMFINDLKNRLQPHATPTLFPGMYKNVFSEIKKKFNTN